MTTTPRWIVVSTSALPANATLRQEAERARAKGLEVRTFVYGPPPPQGREVSAAVETIVAGDRAAQVHGGKVLWGSWDADRRELSLDGGPTLDLAGRRVR